MWRDATKRRAWTHKFRTPGARDGELAATAAVADGEGLGNSPFGYTVGRAIMTQLQLIL